MLKVTNKLTLENVKKSNYWDLISYIVWNHYSETRYQDETLIEIKENWYGKGENGNSSHNNYWNNADYTELNYKRT